MPLHGQVCLYVHLCEHVCEYGVFLCTYVTRQSAAWREEEAAGLPLASWVSNLLCLYTRPLLLKPESVDEKVVTVRTEWLLHWTLSVPGKCGIVWNPLYILKTLV